MDVAAAATPEPLQIKKQLTDWEVPLYQPFRYKVLYGGRGAGKSYAVTDALLLTSIQKKCLIVCGREFQNSIKDSVHSLLRDRIEDLGLTDFFEILRDEIRCTRNGSRFIFIGFKMNIASFKSTSGVTHLWIEEGATLSHESWRIIEPTIRKEGSEIWITFNPEKKTDVVYQQFILNERPNAYVRKINWRDNPWISQETVAMKDYCKETNPSEYMHIWEGELLEQSDSLIFKNRFIVDIFEDDPRAYKYFGLDFGFSQDPTAGIRCFIKDDILFITHEAVRIQLELDQTLPFLLHYLPDLRKYKMYADNARPESISYIRRQGLDIVAAEKWKGCVEDGIEYIKSFKCVVIHPRCVNTIHEFETYSYKVDTRSNEISTDIIDANNHTIDALRYALTKCFKRTLSYDEWKNDKLKSIITSIKPTKFWGMF